MHKEFEPITPDNIRQVLEYNGFSNDFDEDYYYYTENRKFVLRFQQNKTYRFDDDIYDANSARIVHKDLDKVLDFMKKIIELKPLRNDN